MIALFSQAGARPRETRTRASTRRGEPKLAKDELLVLFRYAYGLRNLRLLDATRFATGGALFQDLLIAQLHREARELLDRGLKALGFYRE